MNSKTFTTTIVRDGSACYIPVPFDYTHQREHVEAIGDAKKPETRARRIERAVHHDCGESRINSLSHVWRPTCSHI
jgi:hypothetical protein